MLGCFWELVGMLTSVDEREALGTVIDGKLGGKWVFEVALVNSTQTCEAGVLIRTLDEFVVGFAHAVRIEEWGVWCLSSSSSSSSRSTSRSSTST